MKKGLIAISLVLALVLPAYAVAPTTIKKVVTSTVGAVAFTGSGLDDATSGGTYTGASDATYTVAIDGTGTPDTFKWQKDSGAWTETVSIDGSAQALSESVTITFAATTGHTSADQWTIATTTSAQIISATTIVNKFCVVANANNTGDIYIGDSDVDQTNGWFMDQGDSICIKEDKRIDLSNWWFDGITEDDDIRVMYWSY